jgi:Tfp pilus assembly protein PilN
MSLLSVSKRRRPVTGLDVSADQVVAVMVDAGGALTTASRPLPPGLVHEGEVRDPAALAAELRALFAENKLSRSVRIGLASPRLVVRRVELPAVLKGKELDAAVRFQAGDVLPGALDEVVLDYRALDAEGDKRRVVLAAVRQDIVARWRDAIGLAGLKLEGIDLAGFALARELAAEVDPDPASATLLVHLGDIATMAIVEGGAPVFARATAAGSEPTSEARSAVGFHAGAPGAHPLGRVVLTGVSDDWEATEAAFEQQLGAPVHRDRGLSAEADRFIIATGLAKADGGVSVDLRPGAAERDVLGSPRSKRRRLAPAFAAVAVLFIGIGALYVQAGHSASTRAKKADGLEAQASTAAAQAASLQKFETLATERTSLEGAVRQIAGGRLDWAGILRDIARYTPSDVVLTSLRATVAPGVTVSGSASAGSGGGGGGTQGLRGARTAPAVELTGCAADHPHVSQMLGQMRLVRGVTLVSLSESERLSEADSSSDSNDCRHGDPRRSLFQMVLFFEKAKPVLPPDAGSSATPAAAPTATTPSSSSSTPGTSTTPSQPATATPAGPGSSSTSGSGQ